MKNLMLSLLIAQTMIQVIYKLILAPWTLNAGACKKLYEHAYYEKIEKALKPDGIICALGIQLITNCSIVLLPSHS